MLLQEKQGAAEVSKIILVLLIYLPGITVSPFISDSRDRLFNTSAFH
jgi:hypothetical protein